MTDTPEVNEAYALLAEVIRRSPSDSFQTIATRCNVAVSTVSRVAKMFGLSRNNHITINPEILNEDK